ncbi:hypothetical protein [Phage NBEco005]|uniref:Uncharacterized protein n=1 Tax=Phage NBEco005 TaxID=2712974 RepID=A0A6G9LTI6_9CAUD|nr:hypothetical protein [Phage NBEco005]
MNTKALAAKFSYGDTVSHSEMDTFLGIMKPTYQGDIVKYEDEMKAYALTRLNRLEKFIEKLLKEEKIYLVASMGVGYRVVEPKHQATIAKRKMSGKIGRALKQATQAIENVNTMALSHQERSRLIEQQNHLAAMKANINKQRRKPF